MAGQGHPRKIPASACRSGRKNDGDPAEAAQFLAGHLTDLAMLTRRHGFDTLAYLLDMARLEADETLRRLSGRRRGHG
ncbi:MAG: hypothetical protein WBA66_05260 [Xanthobacteraceae bacterium]